MKQDTPISFAASAVSHSGITPDGFALVAVMGP